MKSTTRLRSLLELSSILVAPGAADALTARLIQEAGFPAVYATGAGIANAQFALPDIGLLTMTEMVEQVQRLANAVDVPVIADADTGYGNPLSVQRTVREYEHAGIAAIQIEDQVSPKKCGH
ncbi:MAG TPA: isocitrate lyase/PEP mutase family protein, partial [Anaerolineae bacterium]